ncbi:type VI secretion protein [Streptomyces sp. JJ66]|uniref:type IV secretory system conjugative DNA transfer family protein n=1 Tax=Streptomyces sp. JJ66 TaxID=2803843 RepID=UPI001C59953D|nr:type IV secretory system conjugative DNA transfer family protein [Streptomyces sp. JJ66]MBW1603336.1 type VI secretion protein [Streptomyces sp. JJ66]
MTGGTPGRPAPATGPARTPGTGVPDGLLLGLLGLLLGGTVLTWTAAGLAGLLAHGAWPPGLSFARAPLALRALVSDPADVSAAWPDTDPAALSGPGLFWGLLIGQLLVLLTLALTVLTSVARRRARKRARAATRQATADAEPSTPVAPSPASSTPAHGPVPAAEAPAPGPVLPPGTTAHSHLPRPGAYRDDPPPTRSPADQPVPLTKPSSSHPAPVHGLPRAEAPFPGAVSGLHLRHGADPAAALDAAAGAALVLTADPELWAATVGARAKLGPVHVYDPTHRTNAPQRLRWAPEHGCAHLDTARARAAALLAPVRSPATVDRTVHDTAETLLRCCLHAAAVSGKPFRQAHRWATGSGTVDAVRILRRDPRAASGTAGELEASLTAHSERRDAATALIRHALAELGQLHVRDACTAVRNDSVALESFAAELGTLYVVGEPAEAPRRQAGVLPLLTALTESVVEHGRSMAERSSSGRLDPPLTLILDDPAALAPLPSLPALLTVGPEWGLHTHAYLRSVDQAHTWWPDLPAASLTTPRP